MNGALRLGAAGSLSLALAASGQGATDASGAADRTPSRQAADAAPSSAAHADPRLREVLYDPRALLTVEVKRGVVTLIVLDPDETITQVASGLGADCAKPQTAWCVAVPPGGRTLFVKPKSTAREPNNLAVVTDRRTHAFRFVVLPDAGPALPVYRLIVRASAKAHATLRAAPAAPAAPADAATSTSATAAQTPATSQRAALETVSALSALAAVSALPQMAPPVPAAQIVQERLERKPEVVNPHYALAEAHASQDIVPTLIFDDGRFTYLKFPGNRELPAVFQVHPDGSEALVNTRMQEDLLVVDRVSRQLMLRSGSAAVGIWNEAFDPEGRPPVGGTTVAGVRRVLKAQPGGFTPPTEQGAGP